jgi:hypothetical protein
MSTVQFLWFAAWPVGLLLVWGLLLAWIMRPLRALPVVQNAGFSIQLTDLFSLMLLVVLPLMFAGQFFQLDFRYWYGFMAPILILLFAVVGLLWFRTCQWLTARSIQHSLARIVFAGATIPGIFFAFLLIPSSLV